MPAQHVAKAAAVLAAISSIAVAPAEIVRGDDASTLFVEVLLGPESHNDLTYTVTSQNNGCQDP